jgi:hypothetical protein
VLSNRITLRFSSKTGRSIYVQSDADRHRSWPASWPKHGFGVWLARAAQRLHPNVLAAALANKLARIAWTVLAQERSYEARVTKAAA